jgi:DNA-binding transcriptional MocR family regulator
MKKQPAGLVQTISKKILGDFFGRFPPGTRLPSEGELAKRYAVSRRTVRAALTDLNANNWVERKPSGRVFIAPYCSGQWRDYLGKLIGISFRSATGWFSDRFCLAVTQAVTKELYRTNLDIKFTS